MSRAATVPAEGDLLCESCGYTLNGLPDDSRCPECGEPIAPSTTENPRKDFDPRNWLRTTFAILFQPTNFFRSLQTRSPGNAAKYFAWTYYVIASMLTAVTIWMHYNLPLGTGNWLGSDRFLSRFAFAAVILIALPIGICFLLEGVTRLAAHLSSWEAALHGWRMPYPAVLRAMYFHAPHYIPAVLLLTLTVLGYSVALRFKWTDGTTSVAYLYVLCAEVIVAAVYLFWTYWIAMKNIMYANR